MVARVSGRRHASAEVFSNTLRLIALALPLALAGCGSADGVGGKISEILVPKPKEMDPALYAATAVCPDVEIRDGTEFMPVFKPGKFGDPAAILFQASVQRVARDCDSDGTNLRIRVGVAGRVLSGPTGATGAATVPVRVVATLGDRVLYSKVTMAAVDVQAPDYSALWSVVDDGVVLSIADSHDATIYAGLDGKAADPKGKGAKPDKPKKAPVTKQ